MRILLLKAADNGDYGWYTHEDNGEAWFMNDGFWTPTVLPYAKTNVVYDESPANVDWWLPEHEDYIDAEIVADLSSLEELEVFKEKNPELFI